MPIPLLFIGVAAVTGATGVGSLTKAGFDQHKAKKLNENSDARLEDAALRLESLRTQCGEALEALGNEKLHVLNHSIHEFLAAFTQIKNVDFTESEGLAELSKLHIDQKDFGQYGALKAPY